MFPHAHRSSRTSRTVVGGKSTWRWPGCPSFPPALRGVAAVVRRRGLLYGESDDGGQWEVVEFCVRRASKASKCSRSCGSSPCRVCTYACTASGVCAQCCGVKGNG